MPTARPSIAAALPIVYASAACPPARLPATRCRQGDHEDSMRSHAFLHLSGLALVALAACTGPAPAQVRPGITVLLTDSAHLIKGKRLGLLSNQTGIDSAGR